MEKIFVLGIFASGTGSNCKAIQTAIESGKLKAKIGVIISNKENAGVLEFAKEKNIPGVCISSHEFDDLGLFHTRILNTLKKYEVNFIVLAGYMKKIGIPILSVYQNKVLNIHPALLPAFGGKGMYGEKVHQAVITYGAKVTGITIHLVDHEYDHGPVVMQKALEVHEDDTVETLAERVLKLEHETYYKAIGLFAAGKIDVIDHKVKIKKD